MLMATSIKPNMYMMVQMDFSKNWVSPYIVEPKPAYSTALQRHGSSNHRGLEPYPGLIVPLRLVLCTFGTSIPETKHYIPYALPRMYLQSKMYGGNNN